jgi:protein involved in ribonucleotide reduction
MAYQLCTNNKRIYDFYNTHTSLDFEQINLLCIDLFENVLQDATATINKSIGSQILTECLENRVRMAEISSGLQLVNANLAKMSSDLQIKMLDIKREYMDEMKPILEKNDTTLLNQINLETVSLITSRIIDKTSLLITETVPDANNKIIHKVQDDIQRFYNDEFKQHLTGVVKTEQLSDLFSNFCTKYDLMMQSIQTPILQVLSMNDERINKNINKQQETQEKMLTNLEEFLNKYKNNSSLKGKFSENLLHKVIIQMFPTAEIADTSKMNHTGDLVVKRENKESIIFENKDYADNVSTEEVNKFIGDCEKQGMHGIILSQNTGIASKKNYHIDIKKGKVLVYVHNVDYSQYKIQIAVDIIDTLSDKLKNTIVDKQENTVSKEVLEDINAEFSKFVLQKEAVINVVKDCQKKIIDEIKTISFPALERYLSTKFGGDQITYTCDVCNRFTTQSKKALASHKRTKECKAHGICDDKIHISIVDK